MKEQASNVSSCQKNGSYGTDSERMANKFSHVSCAFAVRMSTQPLTDTHCSPGGKVHSASQSAVKTILLGEAEDGEVMEAQRVAENGKGILLSETDKG